MLRLGLEAYRGLGSASGFVLGFGIGHWFEGGFILDSGFWDDFGVAPSDGPCISLESGCHDVDLMGETWLNGLLI